MAPRLKNQNRWVLVDQSFLSLFTTFAMVELTNRGAQIVDGLFVSNFLDPDAMASVGIAKVIFSVTGIVSGILSVGMQNRCANELGKGDVRGFCRVFSAVFYLAAAVSVLLGLALYLGAVPMAVLFGASGNGARLAGGAADYLRGTAVGFPSIVLAVVLSSACQLDSAKARVRTAGILQFVANCVLDYAVVKLGWGTFGIALSTALARYLQVGWLLLHFSKKDRMLRFTRFQTSFREMLDVLSRGSERALRALGKVVSPMIVNRIVLYFGGALAMSAFSIQKDLMEFTEILAMGLADAAALQAGVYYGEKNAETMRAMGRTAHRTCFIFLGAAGVLLLAFARQIAGFYVSPQSEIYPLVVFGAAATAFFAPLNGLVRARIAYLNAIRRTRDMQLMTLLSSLVYTVLCTGALGALLGTRGLLTAELLRVVLLLLTTLAAFQIRRKKLLPSAGDYLELPAEFALSPGDVISLDVRDLADVSLVAEQIQLFCRGHGIDAGTGLRAALCFEELAVNIVRFGFPNCKKTPGIDLRVVYTPDELTLRLRDNCPTFNVERRIAEELQASSSERIGLKLIGGLAENLSYVQSLETNNAILKFPTGAGAACNPEPSVLN